MTASHRLIERLFAPVPAAALIALICMAALGFAFAMQYGFNHPPCELCLWQRIPYATAECVAIVSAVFSILANSDKANARTRARNSQIAAWLLGCCAALFLAEAALALYHSGVERHWWQSATSCSLPPLQTNPAGLRDLLLSTPVVRCDEIGWSILGITMANFNIPFSLALAAFSFYAARTHRRKNAK